MTELTNIADRYRLHLSRLPKFNTRKDYTLRPYVSVVCHRLSLSKVQADNKQCNQHNTDYRAAEVEPVPLVAWGSHVAVLFYTASDDAANKGRPQASEQIQTLKVTGQADKCGHQYPCQNVIFLVGHHNL